jgi:hypothetical protein
MLAPPTPVSNANVKAADWSRLATQTPTCRVYFRSGWLLLPCRCCTQHFVVVLIPVPHVDQCQGHIRRQLGARLAGSSCGGGSSTFLVFGRCSNNNILHLLLPALLLLFQAVQLILQPGAPAVVDIRLGQQ